MTFAEFHDAIVEIAGGRYCSAQVRMTFDPDKSALLYCSAYMSDVGWTDEYRSPEEAIEAAVKLTRTRRCADTIAQLGEVAQ